MRVLAQIQVVMTNQLQRSGSHALVTGMLAVLLTACTPLTGVKMSEQDQKAKLGDDAGARSEDSGPRAEDKTSDEQARDAGEVNAAKAKDAGRPNDDAGQAGRPAPAQNTSKAGTGGSRSNAGAAASGGEDTTAELVDVTCVPRVLQEARGQFVQVRCQTPTVLGTDQVEYFALPTQTNQAAYGRFSELANAALLRAASISLRVSAAGRGNDSGCEAARCRTIRAFSRDVSAVRDVDPGEYTTQRGIPMRYRNRVVTMVGVLSLLSLTPGEAVTAQTAPEQAWISCKPKQVMETLGRQLHVQCSNSVTLQEPAMGPTRVVSFIAILASDAAATRFLSMATSAMLADRPFVAYLPGDSATNVAGCAADNCRTPIYFGLAASEEAATSP